jgi:Tfp pilus assembly protein PilF
MLVVLERLDERVCNLNPASSPMAWHGGIAKYQLGQRAEAELDFAKALRYHPYHLHALYNLAICRLEKKDTVATKNLLRKTLDISPSFDKAATLYALLSLRQGDYNIARNTLDNVQLEIRDSYWNTLDRAVRSHEGD